VTPDEAIRDLLDISTDVRGVAVLGPDGMLLASGPGAVAGDLGAAGARLWEAASACASEARGAGLDHVVVEDADGAVAMAEAQGRRIVAVTGPQPAVGLLLFHLRTCLGDAFAGEEASS
jgi:predicted regulator of Ras-like GTPase activity (Roadblock/LC7/MglB family)